VFLTLSVLELCVGAGGQALGLSTVGFSEVVAVDIDELACLTVASNRPDWTVLHQDIRSLSGRPFDGITLVSAGLPSPMRLGSSSFKSSIDSARAVHFALLRIVAEARPRVILLENVPGLGMPRAEVYREWITREFKGLGYLTDWQLLEASEFGVSQLRRRFILVAMVPEIFHTFRWPQSQQEPTSAGHLLADLMAENGWQGASKWAADASGLAPALVAGSINRGGADLGPSGSRESWSRLRIDGKSLADSAPDASAPLEHEPRLTIRMAARLQAFPNWWSIAGKKTAQYRLIGGACPPPMAAALGRSFAEAITLTKKQQLDVFG
jgi:DNA (cytosine-5)-methyltransferase 1